MSRKKIIAFVNNVSKADAKLIKEEFEKMKEPVDIMIIKDTKNKQENKEIKNSFISYKLSVDFNKDTKLIKELKEYRPKIIALVCRQEANISSYKKLIPQFPYLKTPTETSLYWSTDKLAMRERFYNYDKTITPEFLIAKDDEKETVEKIIKKINFPLIVKPANLDSSLLVSICYHKEELEESLHKTLRKIRSVYKKKGRKSIPKIMAEQYMEGEMYSVDGYVNAKGKVYFCPLVRVKTGRDIGFDDFFNYLRIAPVDLNQEQVKGAEEVAKKSVYALGLRSVSLHIELIRLEGDKWKIIEVGPRLGGFRKIIYELSYGINHVLNDVLIRMDKKPVIPKKVKGHTACFKFYPKEQGILKKIKGLNNVKKLESFEKLIMHIKLGERCHFAKNGGKSVLDIVLFNKDKQQMIADIRRAEKTIEIQTDKK